ncbi:DUF4238 domain-containing protein [Actinomadura rayongensis]|uniref:DUF4238 domain-containing protein n=2 Tax=Actinomadura rayongensis TaxID=1429076 RepID=A0A6I4W7L5_9ACTN|nr:DUF4238 domain-containing protein [Actinomadura rayongensis]
MYLRRFAENTDPNKYGLQVRRISNIDKVIPTRPNKVFVECGFYWGTTLENVPHHSVEDLFSQIEGDAATAFQAILDDPDYAFPVSWPLDPAHRKALAWWMAAQILRTTRQRKRLARLGQAANAVEVPVGVAALAANNPHLDFIIENLIGLASILYTRPWGLAFSAACLLTSDVPVVLFNDHDADNQLAAASYCDIALSLDPHRLLLLPGSYLQMEDPNKRIDHRMVFQGAMGLALVQIVYDAADALIAHHPLHDPWRHWKPTGPRLPAPWEGEHHPSPEYAIEYNTLPPNETVEKRWTTQHPA